MPEPDRTLGVAGGYGGRAGGGFSAGGGGGATAFGSTGGQGGTVSAGGVVVCSCTPKTIPRPPLQELLDFCVSEALAEHGPTLTSSIKIYEDMAKRLLAAMLAE